MDLREVHFGLITLLTNGFDRSIYEGLFELDNLPTASEHPRNWNIDKLKELLMATDTPSDNLSSAQIQAIVQSGRTRVSADEINRRNSEAVLDQVCKDTLTGYEVSRGFFQDLLNAYTYCQAQVRVGPNPYSGIVHSDLFIKGEGRTTITSGKGIKYSLSPKIWIEGQKHYWDFFLYLNWPTAKNDNGARLKIRDFLMSHEWGDGLRLVPEYCEKSTEDGKWKKEVYQHNIEAPHLDVYTTVRPAPLFSMYISTPIVGEVKNLKTFCRLFTNQLDEHFTS